MAVLFTDSFESGDFTAWSSRTTFVPRSASPGPGAWGTLVDTGNRLSVFSGVLKSAAGGGVADPGLYSSTTFSRATGMALAFTLKSLAITNLCSVLWRTATGSANSIAQAGIFPASTTAIRNYNTAASATCNITVASMSGADVTFYTILRTAGYWAIKKQAGAYSLVFRWDSGTGTTLPLHLAAIGVANFDNIRVAQLDSPWTDDTNLRLFLSASPSSGDTQTAAAAVFMECDWTPASGGTLEMQIRRASATEHWAVRADNAGNTLRLFEVTGGGETQRATVSPTIADGTTYKVIVHAEGSIINIMLRTAAASTQTSYSSAVTNATATGAAISYANSVVANWEALGVAITGASATQLARMDP